MRLALSSLVIALLVCSCNFSAGTKKDFSTGLSYDYNGFAVDEVLFVGPDNVAKTDNKVQQNTEVAIVAQGLANYEMRDGKAFPGLSLIVTDQQGNFLLNEADLFGDGDGYSAADAAIIRGTLLVGEGMKSGETYRVKMKIWDKTKPENELNAELDIVVE